jgi:glutamyl-Q tRNA(Asp) synthetase
LAVVIDDAEAGVTDVVRGADLHCSTARQIFLQRCLGLPTPRYAHVPVVLNAGGEKLSKQTLAAAIDLAKPAPTLCRALRFLGQFPPRELDKARVADVWQWAMANWQLDRVPRQMGFQERAHED